MLLNLRRWFQFGSILKKWRQCNNCHNYLQWWTNLIFFLHLPVKYLDYYCFFFLLNLLAAWIIIFLLHFFLFFTFLQLWVNTSWWMVNSENCLLMYECFFFHLNLLAARIILFLLYVSVKLVKYGDYYCHICQLINYVS